MCRSFVTVIIPSGRAVRAMPRRRATLHSSSPFRAHVLFDDSLHPPWTLHHSEAIADAQHNHSVKTDGAACARSLRLVLRPPSGHVRLRASAPLRDREALSLQFWVQARSAQLATERCEGLGQSLRAGWRCAASICMSLRLSSEPEAAAHFVPLCTFGTPTLHGWSKLVVPASAYASFLGDMFDEIVLLAGGVAHGGEPANKLPAFGPRATAVELLLDEVMLVSTASRPALPGSLRPMPRADAVVRQSNGWCKYLSSDIPLTGRDAAAAAESKAAALLSSSSPEALATNSAKARAGRPPCRVANGDHLQGRWLQNCAPESIRRPDRYAYGRALSRHAGPWDYRLCYKMGYVERERARATLTWSWRPDSCVLSTVDGLRFATWLGQRTMLFIGDSLTAQHFFSLVLLLGSAVVSVTDAVPDPSRGSIRTAAPARGSCAEAAGRTKCGACEYEGLGAEGGAFTEARLLGGGRLVKVLGHVEMAEQLGRGMARAWWLDELAGADVIVFNYVGHHLRTMDPSFRTYPDLVGASLRALARHAKPTAHLIMRTSNLGHAKCETQMRPLTSRAEAWRQLGGYGWRPKPGFVPKYYGEPRRGIADVYDWRAPVLAECEWTRQVTGRPSLRLAERFSVLNVSHVDLRSDGHVGDAMRHHHDKKIRSAKPDCLHYCFPGPADSWAVALYNMLLNNPETFNRSQS